MNNEFKVLFFALNMHGHNRLNGMMLSESRGPLHWWVVLCGVAYFVVGPVFGICFVKR